MSVQRMERKRVTEHNNLSTYLTRFTAAYWQALISSCLHKGSSIPACSVSKFLNPDTPTTDAACRSAAAATAWVMRDMWCRRRVPRAITIDEPAKRLPTLPTFQPFGTPADKRALVSSSVGTVQHTALTATV